jgi:hypothetical protein
MTTNILVFYVSYFVSCLSVQYLLFNVFLTQNYKLQFSFNVIITLSTGLGRFFLSVYGSRKTRDGDDTLLAQN